MKTLKEIKRFYQVDLRKDLVPLQKERNQIYKKTKTLKVIVYIAAAILYVVILLLFDMLSKPFIMILSFAAILFLASLLYLEIKYSLYKKNRLNFKNKIVKKLFHFIDEDLVYLADSYVLARDYIESKLYIRKIQKYDGKNFVRGKIDGTNFCFSQINTTYNSIDFEDGSGTILFNGIFFVGHLEKDLASTTILIPRSYPKYMLKCLEMRNGVRIPSIKMDSPELNEYFITYGWHPDHTKNLLTPELTRKIIDFKKKEDRYCSLSFIGSKAFLAVRHLGGTFEPGLSVNIMSFDCVRPYFKNLIFFMDIIDAVNSNTKKKV